MGATRRFHLASCLAVAALGACVPRAVRPAPQPAPMHRPTPTPPQPPAPLPAPPTAWQDGPLAPGDWSYAGGTVPQASFASPGGTLFALRCDAGRQVRILRPGVLGGAITIVTGFGQRVVPGAGDDGQALATLPASDPLFDQIVFSRGRFLVRVAGGGDLVLPSWPEPARLIEDCRG